MAAEAFIKPSDLLPHLAEALQAEFGAALPPDWQDFSSWRSLETRMAFEEPGAAQQRALFSQTRMTYQRQTAEAMAGAGPRSTSFPEAAAAAAEAPEAAWGLPAHDAYASGRGWPEPGNMPAANGAAAGPVAAAAAAAGAPRARTQSPRRRQGSSSGGGGRSGSADGSSERRYKFYGPPVCLNCQEEGHRADTCAVPVCSDCGTIGHAAGQCTRACRRCGRVHAPFANGSRFHCDLTQCRECKQWGHVSARCPQVKCSTCGLFGHLKRDCHGQPCDSDSHAAPALPPAGVCTSCGAPGHVPGHCTDPPASKSSRSSRRSGRSGSSSSAAVEPGASQEQLPAQVLQPHNTKLRPAARGAELQARNQHLLNVLLDNPATSDYAASLFGDEDKLALLSRVADDVLRATVHAPDATQRLDQLYAAFLKGSADGGAGRARKQARQQQDAQQQQQDAPPQQPQQQQHEAPPPQQHQQQHQHQQHQQQEAPPLQGLHRSSSDGGGSDGGSTSVPPNQLPRELADRFEASLAAEYPGMLPEEWSSYSSWRKLEDAMSMPRRRCLDARKRFRDAKTSVCTEALALLGGRPGSAAGDRQGTAQQPREPMAHQQQQQLPPVVPAAKRLLVPPSLLLPQFAAEMQAALPPGLLPHGWQQYSKWRELEDTISWVGWPQAPGEARRLFKEARQAACDATVLALAEARQQQEEGESGQLGQESGGFSSGDGGLERRISGGSRLNAAAPSWQPGHAQQPPPAQQQQRKHLLLPPCRLGAVFAAAMEEMLPPGLLPHGWQQYSKWRDLEDTISWVGWSQSPGEARRLFKEARQFASDGTVVASSSQGGAGPATTDAYSQQQHYNNNTINQTQQQQQQQQPGGGWGQHGPAANGSGSHWEQQAAPVAPSSFGAPPQQPGGLQPPPHYQQLLLPPGMPLHRPPPPGFGAVPYCHHQQVPPPGMPLPGGLMPPHAAALPPQADVRPELITPAELLPPLQDALAAAFAGVLPSDWAQFSSWRSLEDKASFASEQQKEQFRAQRRQYQQETAAAMAMAAPVPPPSHMGPGQPLAGAPPPGHVVMPGGISPHMMPHVPFSNGPTQLPVPPAAAHGAASGWQQPHPQQQQQQQQQQHSSIAVQEPGGWGPARGSQELPGGGAGASGWPEDVASPVADGWPVDGVAEATGDGWAAADTASQPDAAAGSGWAGDGGVPQEVAQAAAPVPAGRDHGWAAAPADADAGATDGPPDAQQHEGWGEAPPAASAEPQAAPAAAPSAAPLKAAAPSHKAAAAAAPAGGSGRGADALYVPVGPPVCSKCGLEGHKRTACSTFYCDLCKAHGHNPGECRKACEQCRHMHKPYLDGKHLCSMLQCSSCRKWGHRAALCPALKCERCRHLGHPARSCPACPDCWTYHAPDACPGYCSRCDSLGHTADACRGPQQRQQQQAPAAHAAAGSASRAGGTRVALAGSRGSASGPAGGNAWGPLANAWGGQGTVPAAIRAQSDAKSNRTSSPAAAAAAAAAPPAASLADTLQLLPAAGDAAEQMARQNDFVNRLLASVDEYAMSLLEDEPRLAVLSRITPPDLEQLLQHQQPAEQLERVWARFAPPPVEEAQAGPGPEAAAGAPGVSASTASSGSSPAAAEQSQPAAPAAAHSSNSYAAVPPQQQQQLQQHGRALEPPSILQQHAGSAELPAAAVPAASGGPAGMAQLAHPHQHQPVPLAPSLLHPQQQHLMAPYAPAPGMAHGVAPGVMPLPPGAGATGFPGHLPPPAEHFRQVPVRVTNSYSMPEPPRPPVELQQSKEQPADEEDEESQEMLQLLLGN